MPEEHRLQFAVHMYDGRDGTERIVFILAFTEGDALNVARFRASDHEDDEPTCAAQIPAKGAFLSHTDYVGVIVDGSVRRDWNTRIDMILAQLDAMISLEGDRLGRETTEELQAKHDALCKELGIVLSEEDMDSIEDSAIALINQTLPDEFICTLGEFNPGDVIIREVQHVDDETKAMGD